MIFALQHTYNNFTNNSQPTPFIIEDRETAEETVEKTAEETVEKTVEETVEKTVEETAEETADKIYAYIKQHTLFYSSNK